MLFALCLLDAWMHDASSARRDGPARRGLVGWLALTLVLGLAGARAAHAALPDLSPLVAGDFAAKGAVVDAIAASGDARATLVLNALNDGRLFVRKSDTKLVIANGDADPREVSAAEDGAALEPTPAAELKKVGINNQLRIALRGALARLALANPDRAARLAAVNALIADTSPGAAQALRDVREKEQDDIVRTAIDVVLALHDLDASDAAVRRAAVATVSTSLQGEVRNRLAQMLEKDAGGAPREADAGVRRAAEAAIRAIDTRRDRYALAETLFFGLSLGCVLLLAATGLAITFGVMGVINMAHGELMMLGAYTTYVVQQAMPNHIAWSIPVAIPAAFIVAALAGIAIERGVVRFLYGRPLETLLATFGISLFLQQAVRTVFSPLNRAVQTPEWMSGQIVINEALSLTANRVWIMVFSLLVFAGLQALLRFTPLGLQVRAVAQNRAMARALGVRAAWVDALTFGLGSGVAGLAGVALSQLTNVGPNLGQAYIVDSFMVVVFGGVGNLWGTLVAGLSLGVANKVLEPYAGAVLAKILVLVAIMLFIQKWPRGLFPQRGRAAEG